MLPIHSRSFVTAAFGLVLVLAALPGAARAAAPAPPKYTRYGSSRVGFTVNGPAGWTVHLIGSAVQGAELDLTGPKGSGLTALVSQQPLEPGITFASLLPNHSRILSQNPLALAWARGTDTRLLHDLGTAASGDKGRSLELHAVFGNNTRIYHVAVSVAPGYWPAQQTMAESIYTTMVHSLTPALPGPAIRFDLAAARRGAGAPVEGSGWPAGMRVQFSLGGVNTGASGNYGSAVANSQGAFSAVVTLDRYPSGSPITTPSTVVLVAHSADWKLKATAAIVVASPTLSLDRSSGPAGSTVTLRGQGWPTGTRVSVAVGGINAGAGGKYGSAVADRAGTFTLRITLNKLPNGASLPPGNVVLVAHNPDSSLTAAASFTVTGKH